MAMVQECIYEYWEEENLITSDNCGWTRTWHLKQFSFYVKHRPQRQGHQTRAGTSSLFSEIQHNWKLICNHPDLISRRFLGLHFQRRQSNLPRMVFVSDLIWRRILLLATSLLFRPFTIRAALNESKSWNMSIAWVCDSMELQSHNY